MRSAVIPVILLTILAPGVSSILSAGEIDHSPYDSLLKKYTKDGLVNYGAIAEDVAPLETYLGTLSDSSAVYYNTWGRSARMAFWINAYNAITIYAVASNYPIKPGRADSTGEYPDNSVWKIEDFWETEYLALAGRPVSLEGIEHMLRSEFRDPRAHFALARASMGGPFLSSDAYLAETLDEQLENSARRFVNDGDKVRVNVTRGRLYASEIFEWYADDFAVPGDDAPAWLDRYGKKTRGFVSFIAERVDDNTRKAIMKSGLKITYLEYDWSLNERPAED